MGQDAYAARNRRKKAKGQGCVIAALVGGSFLAGLALVADVLRAVLT